jgi:plastocyanin
MRLRMIVAGFVAATVLLAFQASDVFAQRYGGGWGGYRGGWGGYGWRGYGWGGYGVGLSVGRPWYGGYRYGFSYPYSSYYYSPGYVYSYPDTTYDYSVPSTSYYYSPPTETYAQPAPAPQPVNLTMTDNSFGQPQLVVRPGTRVIWRNGGQTNHTVTSSNGLWNSGDIPPGGTYDCTFNAPGTYTYSDRHNPNMRGEVIVR